MLAFAYGKQRRLRGGIDVQRRLCPFFIRIPGARAVQLNR